MERSKRMLIRLAALLLPMALLSGCFVYVHDDGCSTCYPNTLYLQNSDYSYYAIEYAYVAPSDSATWGSDLLGNDVLYPGEEIVLDVYECDRYYDIRVEYEDGTAVEKDGIFLPCDTMTVVGFEN